MFSSELCTCSPSSPPLYSMNPILRNLFMKKLTLERVVPIISASVSWLILGITGSGFPSFPKWASSRSTRASLFSLELKSWSIRFLLNPHIPGEQIDQEHLGKGWLIVKQAGHGRFLQLHDRAVRHRGGRGQAQRLGLQTSLAEEVAGS